MELISVECPSCGAKLPPKQPCGSYQCDYCGKAFDLGQAKKAQTQAGAAVDLQAIAKALLGAQQAQLEAARLSSSVAPTPTPTPRPKAKSGRGCGIASIGLTLTILASVFIPLYFTFRSVSETFGIDIMSQVGQGLAAVTAGERVIWDGAGGAPQVAQVGGEVLIVGRTRAVGQGDALYCSVYATDGELRWRSESLGTYSASYKHASCTLAGDVLVSVDGEAQLRIHALADGAERHAAQSLTDAVDRICAAGPEEKQEQEQEGDAAATAAPTRLWVHQIDERASWLDLATGTLSEAENKAPKGCARKRRRQAQHDLLELAGVRVGERKEAPKKLDGAKVELVLISGENGVAFGHTSPGTKVPYAAGFSTADKEILWQMPTPSVAKTQVRRADSYAAIVGDKLVNTYGTGKEDWMITGFDLVSGDRVWETKLRPIFAVDSISGIVPAGTHVLVIRTSSIDIFDASTGAQTGTIGTETYDS